MPVKAGAEQKPGASEMSWGRMETRQWEPSDPRAKEGGSEKGKRQGGQVGNACEKGSVRDGSMSYGKNRLRLKQA